MSEDAYSYQVPVRRAIVNNRDPLGRMSLYYPDSGAGGSVMPPPILGGATTGFHTMPNIADEVAILSEWPNRPFASISVVERNQLSLLPTLAPGESVTIAADGRQVGYLKSDGSTLLYNKPSGASVAVATSGNVSIVTPAAGSIVLNAGVGGTIVATGATILNQALTVTGATQLNATLGVAGATILSSTLGVTGATTLSTTLAVTGVTTLSGNVQQAISSPAWVITAAGGGQFSGALTGIGGSLKLGTAQMQGQLDMNGYTVVNVPSISALTTMTLASGGAMLLQAAGGSNITLSTTGTVVASNGMAVNGTLTVGGVATMNSTTNLNGGSTVFGGIISSANGTAYVRLDPLGNATLAGTVNTGPLNTSGALNLNNNTLNGLSAMNGSGAIALTSTGGNNITLSTTASVVVTTNMFIGGTLYGNGHPLNLNSVSMSGQLDMGNQSIIGVFSIKGYVGSGILTLDLQNQNLAFSNIVNGGPKSGTSFGALKIDVAGNPYYIPYYT